MNPERWRQIEAVFQAVVELEPGQHAAFLDQSCAGDLALRREVESLLANDLTGGESIRFAIGKAAEEAAQDPSDRWIGRRIGAYRITSFIGQGGMGTVYAAIRADDQFERQVAIKLVRRGFDSEELLSRFRHERQILANLDHPHVARLLDGGTTEDGLPYLVMEHVEGVPITEHCWNRQLSVEEQLKLFRLVCAAVQHAHQNLVVHRDLKPANVLVTREGTPKLLDFGIAKLLEEGSEGEATITAMRVLTPEYASPEQIRGDVVTTVTDVYSLGLMLYEMLTGTKAHSLKGGAAAEVERVICHQQADLPSLTVGRRQDWPERLRRQWQRQLRGDVDNIVKQALRKEPERRYRSAEQMAEDIRRHLAGFPILARREGPATRGAKFIRRHKLAVGAAATIALTLAGGNLAAAYQARQAERRFEQVRKLAHTFLFDIHDKLRSIKGSTGSRARIAETALTYLDSLAQEAEGDRSLQTELALAYEKVGDAQGAPDGSNLGRADAALRNYQRSAFLGGALLEHHSGSPELLALVARTSFKMGDLLLNSGDVSTAAEKLNQGLKHSEVLATGAPLEPTGHLLMADGFNRTGEAQLRKGEVANALVSYQKALQLFARWESDPSGDPSGSGLAATHRRIGHGLLQTGDLKGALDRLRQAIAIRERLQEQSPRHQANQQELSNVYRMAGNILGNPFYLNLGETAPALAYYQKALTIHQEQAAADLKDARAKTDLSISYGKVGTVLRDLEPRESAAAFRKALEITEALLKETPRDAQVQDLHAFNYSGLAYALSRQGDRDMALDTYRRALMLQQAIPGGDAPQFRQSLVTFHGEIGELLLENGEPAAARKHFEKALQIAMALHSAQPSRMIMRRHLADCYERMGLLSRTLAASSKLSRERRQQHWHQARSWYRRSEDLWSQWEAHAVSSVFDQRRHSRASQLILECERQIANLGH
jgi:tetratricopeptide (TPR) repeat protein/tRNA A-37 threonylcarbamoyl transferase component Bud32